MFEESLEEFQWSQGLRDSDLGTKTDPNYVRTKFHEKSLEKQACQVKINWFLWIILHFAQIRMTTPPLYGWGRARFSPTSSKLCWVSGKAVGNPLVVSPVSHMPLKQFSEKTSWRLFDGNTFTLTDKLHRKKDCILGKISTIQNCFKKKTNKNKQQPHAFSFQSQHNLSKTGVIYILCWWAH